MQTLPDESDADHTAPTEVTSAQTTTAPTPYVNPWARRAPTGASRMLDAWRAMRSPKASPVNERAQMFVDLWCANHRDPLGRPWSPPPANGGSPVMDLLGRGNHQLNELRSEARRAGIDPAALESALEQRRREDRNERKAREEQRAEYLRQSRIREEARLLDEIREARERIAATVGAAPPTATQNAAPPTVAAPPTADECAAADKDRREAAKIRRRKELLELKPRAFISALRKLRKGKNGQGASDDDIANNRAMTKAELLAHEQRARAAVKRSERK